MTFKGPLLALTLAISIPLTWMSAAVAASPAETCGIHSGNFARQCSPSARLRCRRGAERGLIQSPMIRCQAEEAACHTCLANLHACTAAIRSRKGQNRTQAKCAACAADFDRCYVTEMKIR